MCDTVSNLEGFLALQQSPPRSFEDLAIVFCLYPWLRPVGGSSIVHWPSKRSHGHRWGMSDTYEPGVPHYGVAKEVVLCRPPKGTLYVTAAQAFETILDPATSMKVIEASRDFNYYSDQRVTAEREQPLTDTLLEIFSNALPSDQWEHREYGPRFAAMLSHLRRKNHSRWEMWSLRFKRNIIGFQIVWDGQGELLQVFRFVMREHRSASRLLDYAVLQNARERGLLVNIGDAYRIPSLQGYKASLKPVDFRPTFNVLAHAEAADYEVDA